MLQLVDDEDDEQLEDEDDEEEEEDDEEEEELERRRLRLRFRLRRRGGSLSLLTVPSSVVVDQVQEDDERYLLELLLVRSPQRRSVHTA